MKERERKSEKSEWTSERDKPREKDRTGSN